MTTSGIPKPCDQNSPRFDLARFILNIRHDLRETHGFGGGGREVNRLYFGCIYICFYGG